MQPLRFLDPPVSSLATRNPRQTAFMRYFQPSADARADDLVLERWTPLAAISPLLIAAIVKAEDRPFFTHRGVNWRLMLQMAWRSLRARRIIGGGSTITQQLARNLYLTPSRTMTRKTRELLLAFRIERATSKPRILELYLNVIEWGPRVWGCTAASARYFAKAPRDLDLFESTFLATLVPAPKATIAGRNATRMHQTQLWLIYRMFLSGLADGEECASSSHRVWQLHRLLAAGTPLPQALLTSREVEAGDGLAGEDGEVLRGLASELGLRRLDAADLLSSHCGDAQQRTAWARLCARFSEDALRDVLRTNSFAGLRQR